MALIYPYCMYRSHGLTLPCPYPTIASPDSRSRILALRPVTASHLFTPTYQIDRTSVLVAEMASEDELWAAACLRVRSFHNFPSCSYGIQDHNKYLAKLEFEALKERIAGMRTQFGRVSCINATIPLSQLDSNVFSDYLSMEYKYVYNGEDRVVVGTLDLNQCLRLPDEIIGKRPEGIGADFARAYLSNVCVWKELHRNGLGYELVAKSKLVAQEWGKKLNNLHNLITRTLIFPREPNYGFEKLGITDLYVHVAVDNEPAKNLYSKSGFQYENDEPAWQARFLDRPRRLLLWIGLPSTLNLGGAQNNLVVCVIFCIFLGLRVCEAQCT